MKALVFLSGMVLLASCSMPAAKHPPPPRPALASYDSARSYRANLERGWIDTFRVGGALFRLRYDSVQYDVVEKRSGTGWERNTVVDGGEELERSDGNGDGFPDLVTYSNGWSEVLFFDPRRRCFDTTTYFMGADGTDTLDAARGLYYTRRERYHGCDPLLHSQLFALRDGRPRFLYFLDFVTGCADTVLLRVDLLAADSSGRERGPLLRSYKPAKVQPAALREFWSRLPEVRRWGARTP